MMNISRLFIVVLVGLLISACKTPPGGAGAGAALPVVAAGIQSTCILGPDKMLSCTGAMVGNGTPLGEHRDPIQPTGIGKVKAIALSAYSHLGCAIVGDSATTGPSGPVWCWTGNGLPTQVNDVTDAIKISVGGPGACAILTDRSLKCWKLDDGTGLYSSAYFLASPSSVRGLTGSYNDVSVGGHFACAIELVMSQVYCWGRNDFGQLGQSPISASANAEFDPKIVSGITAIAVASGQTHACSIAPNRSVNCWGEADFGELGNGSTTPGSNPIPQTVEGISTAVNISSGRAFSCVTLSDLTAKCWGQNLPSEKTAGTLGVGNLIGSASPGPPPSITFIKPQAVSTPVTVRGLKGAVFISASISHACASGWGEMFRCWGTNTEGELPGFNSPEGSGVPVP